MDGYEIAQVDDTGAKSADYCMFKEV